MKDVHHALRRRVSTAWMALLAVVFMTACSDAAETPISLAPEGPAAARSAGSGGSPHPIPASVPYANTGKPNATGRAGSAEVTARALFGQDGMTTLEVTTGQLDSAEPAPGHFAKIQVKLFDDGRRPLFAENHKRPVSTGYWSETYEGVIPGMTLQVQANVRGIDRNRTGVVTLREEVKRRPDLWAQITAPAEAEVGSGVFVLGTMLEANGDVGAWFDCVLYVDGQEADRLAEVWVDAGGDVACEFNSLTFGQPGSYLVEVAAEGVTPGDYDTANNRTSATIEITASAEFGGYVYASDWEGIDRRATGFSGDPLNLSYGTAKEGRIQTAALVVTESTGAEVFANATHVTFKEYSEGDLLIDASFELEPANGRMEAIAPGYRMQVYPDRAVLVRSSADVIYFSSTAASWDETDETIVLYQPSATIGDFGPIVDWGSDITVEASIQAAGSYTVGATTSLSRQPVTAATGECYSSGYCSFIEREWVETYGFRTF